MPTMSFDGVEDAWRKLDGPITLNRLQKTVDGSGLRQSIVAFYEGCFWLAEDFYRLMMMMVELLRLIYLNLYKLNIKLRLSNTLLHTYLPTYFSVIIEHRITDLLQQNDNNNVIIMMKRYIRKLLLREKLKTLTIYGKNDAIVQKFHGCLVTCVFLKIIDVFHKKHRSEEHHRRTPTPNHRATILPAFLILIVKIAINILACLLFWVSSTYLIKLSR